MVEDLCFEIIQKCPNECMFCSSNATYQKELMVDLDTFKQVIDRFMELGGIKEISLSGGEPFLHPNLYDMILYCKTLGIRTVLFTSGVRRNIRLNEFEMSMLNKKVEDLYYGRGWPEEECQKAIRWEQGIYRRANSKEFNSIYRAEMEYLKWAGLDKIVFDLQGGNTDTYRCLMGRDHFDLVMTSIIRAHVVGLETDVHFVPMKSNYREFPDLLEMLNDEEVKEFRKIYLKSKELFKGNIRVGIPLSGEDSHKCTAGLGKLVIRYDGTVLPCPAFKEFDLERLKNLGIPVWNIYQDLDKIKISNGTRCKPLCKRLYKMNRNID